MSSARGKDGTMHMQNAAVRFTAYVVREIDSVFMPSKATRTQRHIQACVYPCPCPRYYTRVEAHKYLTQKPEFGYAHVCVYVRLCIERCYMENL